MRSFQTVTLALLAMPFALASQCNIEGCTTETCSTYCQDLGAVKSSPKCVWDPNYSCSYCDCQQPQSTTTLAVDCLYSDLRYSCSTSSAAFGDYTGSIIFNDITGCNFVDTEIDANGKVSEVQIYVYNDVAANAWCDTSLVATVVATPTATATSTFVA